GRPRRRGDRMSTAPTPPTSDRTPASDRAAVPGAAASDPAPTARPADREERTLAAARAHRSRENSLRTRDLVLSIAAPVVLVVLWELCARLLIIDPRFFPPPTKILAALWSMLRDGELWTHTGPTLLRLLVGGGLGALAG